MAHPNHFERPEDIARREDGTQLHTPGRYRSLQRLLGLASCLLEALGSDEAVTNRGSLPSAYTDVLANDRTSQDNTVQLFKAFRPMLCHRNKNDFEDIVKAMGSTKKAVRLLVLGLNVCANHLIAKSIPDRGEA